MNYAVLNSDEASTGEKLEKYTGEIQWSYLKPHFEAGSLVWVSEELSITEVGEAISDDESDRVQSWKRVVIKKFEKPKGWLSKKLSSSSNQMDQLANILEERSIWQRYGF